MKTELRHHIHDFKGIGFSKIGHFKEVRAKIKELEKLNIKLARRGNRLEAMFHSMSDGVTILDRNLNIVFANHVQKNMFPDVSMIGQKCFSAFYRKDKICKNCPSLKTIRTRETRTRAVSAAPSTTAIKKRMTKRTTRLPSRLHSMLQV